MGSLRRWTVGTVLCISLSACPTQFKGSPTIPGGVAGCARMCHADGMVPAAFVYVGEYSTACVCEPRPTGNASSAGASGGASGGAGAAVMTAMRAAQQQQQQQQQMH